MNLEKHIENLQKYGVPVVVTLNSFITDSEAETAYVREFCETRGCEFALSEVWEKGGEGGIALAEKVLKQSTKKRTTSMFYMKMNCLFRIRSKRSRRRSTERLM